jgi:hypothetical protein
VSAPARPERSAGAPRAASPYRSPVLWRVHGASTLLVVPQFVVAAFSVDFLVREASWSAFAAGAVAAVLAVGVVPGPSASSRGAPRAATAASR